MAADAVHHHSHCVAALDRDALSVCETVPRLVTTGCVCGRTPWGWMLGGCPTAPTQPSCPGVGAAFRLQGVRDVLNATNVAHHAAPLHHSPQTTPQSHPPTYIVSVQYAPAIAGTRSSVCVPRCMAHTGSHAMYRPVAPPHTQTAPLRPPHTRFVPPHCGCASVLHAEHAA